MAQADRPCEIFPASPNWFSTCVTAVCLPLSLYVYASRNKVIALNTNTLRVRTSFVASQHKLNAIAIHGTTCFTTGQDKAIRSWDLETGQPQGGHTRHQSEVYALCWAKNGEILLSGDKAGQLSIWQRPQSTVASKVHFSSAIKCISRSNADDQDIFAIGYANGMIIVGRLNQTNQFETLYRLENQIDEIQSLQWQIKIKEEENSDGGVKWPKLASGSRDGTLVVWNVQQESVFRKVTPPKDKQLTTNQQARSFMAAAWSVHEAERLYFSSYNGDFMIIDLGKPVPKANKMKRFSEFHTRPIFGVDMVDDGRCAISYSMDRTIVKWDVKSMKKSFSIRTMGSNRIFLGCDSNIKIWTIPISADGFDAHIHAGNVYASENVWKGLKGKITKVKWHPTNEGSLIYGTEYGSVGLMDTYTSKNITFKSYHNSTIYSLDWIIHSDTLMDVLQQLEGNSQGPWLVSSDGKSIFLHDIYKQHKAALDIDQILSESNRDWISSVKEKGIQRCDVAISNEAGFMAIGNSDGSVEVYSLRTLRLVYTANNQTKRTNSMMWRMTNGTNGTYLATGSADATVCIHDLSDIPQDNLPAIPVPASSFVQLYRGHLQEITEIAWSPTGNNELIASASSDGNIIIWSLEHDRIVHCISTLGRVKSLCWSPTAPGLLYSGGEDHCVNVWRLSDLPPFDNSKQVKRVTIETLNLNAKLIGKAGLENNKAVPAKRAADVPTPNSLGTPIRKKAKGNVDSQLLAAAEAAIQSRNRITTCSECLHLAVIAGNTVASIMEYMVNETKIRIGDGHADRREQFIRCCSLMPGTDQNGDQNVSSLLFKAKNDVRDLINQEVITCDRTEASKSLSGVSDLNIPTTFDRKIILDLLTNNQALLENNENDSSIVTLEDWITVALSPMASRDLWESKITRLAAKLAATNNPHGAVMCYLAVYDVYRAIEVYRKAKLFKEAIALAKLRLPQGDDIHSELFNEWGAELEINAQYELAAKCYLQSRRPGYEVNTLNALARPSDSIALYCTLAEVVEIDTAAQLGYDLQPIVIVECSRFAPAPIVVVRRESTPDGQPPVIIVRGEGLPNKNPVILDRRVNRLKPLVVIDQREDPLLFDGGEMMMGNQAPILDEAGNPFMPGLPQGMGFADMNGNNGIPQMSGMPQPMPTGNGNLPRSSYLRRKPLRVFPAFQDGDDSITIAHPSSDTASERSSLSDFSNENGYPMPQFQSNLAPIPEMHAPYGPPRMANNGNRRVRFDDGPPQQHFYEPEPSDDEGTYEEAYDQYMPAGGGGGGGAGAGPMHQPNWNYAAEDPNMRMPQPQPMQPQPMPPQQSAFDPSWNRPVTWGDEPQQLPNGNWPMPKPRWRLHHAEV
ncbi:hypothetical protein NQZ79_g7887 [Umbelopsis isabellina]|nr:hypothetical protein NQZ79_g7887 [Umbelopsis isabellina]